MEQRQSYLKNAVILTGTGLILRFAGMFFRVYIAGQLGSEGMGLYQLIFSLYNLAIAAATSGIAVTAARMVAEELSRGDSPAVLGVLRKVLRVALLLGSGAGILQFLLAYPAAKYWLGDSRAQLSLQVLAPSLPFMALSAALRGYFLGRRQTLPGAKAQLLEQTVRLLMVPGLLYLLLPWGTQYACAAVLLGNTVSETLSCGCMFWFYRRDRRRHFAGITAHTPVDAAVRLWAVLLPIEGGRCLASGLQAAENMLVPACLAVFLHSRETALAQYGALKGMALPVLFFPFSFLSALSTLLMPEITAAHLQHRQKTLQRLISRMMFLTMTVAVLMAGLFTLYAPDFGELLYQDEQVGHYIRVLGPLMPWMYLESMVDGVLKGMGQQMATFRYSLWDSMLRIGGVLVLLPRWGMSGFLAVMLVSNLFTCGLNTRRMLKTAGLKMRWCSWLFQPAVALAAACLLARAALMFLAVPGGLPALLAGIGMIGGLYVVLMLPLGLCCELRMVLSRCEKA